MEPYYEHGDITIYHGDCREVMADMADASVNAIITDPPYNVSDDIPDITFDNRADMVRDFGEWDRLDWHPQSLIDAAARLLVPGGALLAFTSDRLLGTYRTPSLKVRGTIVWEKTNPAPSPRPGYVSATEWIIWLQQPGAAGTWNSGGYVPNILRHSTPRDGYHPTQKPDSLVRELLLRHTTPGDVVIDPFAGSGTTLRAAKDLGRKAIGIEVEERYCEIATQRLSQEVML